MKQVDQAMRVAIEEQIFPGAAIMIATQDQILFEENYGVSNLHTNQPITKETIFDLASLTKPLSTTLSIMVLIKDGLLNLDWPLSDILHESQKTDKKNITCRQLLCHASGLPAYTPYFESLKQVEKENRQALHKKLLLKESMGHPPCYSDIGFMFLEWIINKMSGQRIDAYIHSKIYQPLGLNNLFYIDLFDPNHQKIDFQSMQFAATENCPWRKKVLEGEVHDDNAYSLGGICGHAGLFGTAKDVMSLLIKILNAYLGNTSHNKYFDDQSLFSLFLTPQKNINKTLGFDIPTYPNSSAGHYFSKHTVGHLAFTGCSFWIDLEKSLIILLLTNRVHPTRKNEKIKQFRPYIHDMIMKARYIRQL